MKKYILFIVAIALLMACTMPESKNLSTTDASENPVVEKIKDGVFIHVSSGFESPGKVAMALSIAVKFAESHDVALFFDLEGVNVIAKEAKEIALANYISSKDALKTLREQGVSIMACPMCLKAAGFAKSDLINDVMIAEKEKFFEFTKGRILNLDY